MGGPQFENRLGSARQPQLHPSYLPDRRCERSCSLERWRQRRIAVLAAAVRHHKLVLLTVQFLLCRCPLDLGPHFHSPAPPGHSTHCYAVLQLFFCSCYSTYMYVHVVATICSGLRWHIMVSRLPCFRIPRRLTPKFGLTGEFGLM